MIVHLCLEAKVQKLRLGESEDVITIPPLQGLDGDDWVKTRHCQLKHPPEIILAIVGFIAYGSKDPIDVGRQAPGDQAWEEIH